MEAGTGKAKSDNVFEGLDEAQIRILEQVGKQLEKCQAEARNLAGLDFEGTATVKGMLMRWCYDKNRGSWVLCDPHILPKKAE